MTDQTLSSLTDELLKRNCISCASCKNILISPVTLIENVGNVCSNCLEGKQDISNRISLKNIALDTILELLKLPCKFKEKGCNEQLSYEDLISHQNMCKYRTRLCSMFKFDKCNWEGNTNDFLNHFRESHGDHIINFENNLFFLQISLNEMNVVKLLIMKNHTYILRMQTNLYKNKLYYAICNVQDDQVCYEYSVKHKGNSHNYIKTKSKILPSCNIYDEFNENVAVQVDIDALKQVAHISDTITNIFKIKVDDIQINEKMLNFFECPICKSFMKPPIYQCQSGHSICNLCRPRVEKCPTCRASFGSIRNYSLEGLTAGMQYPCIYHDLGCTEASTPQEITKHEKECLFKPHSCPFPTCTSTGNHQAIITHLKEFHPDEVIFSGSTGYTDSFRLDQNFYNKIFDRKCIIAYNHIFRLSCKRVAEQYLWAAEVFGSVSESKIFIYEVAIIDVRRPEKKLIKTDYCLSEVSEEELFKRCIMFPNGILSSYSNHGMITFQFTVNEK